MFNNNSWDFKFLHFKAESDKKSNDSHPSQDDSDEHSVYVDMDNGGEDEGDDDSPKDQAIEHKHETV